MKEILKLVFVTMIFCLVAGALLAITNRATQGRIAEVKKEAMSTALKNVLPVCNNDVMADSVTIKDNGIEWTYYVARQDGQYVGTAFRSVSPDGYAGNIAILVGVNKDSMIHGIEILECNETPGLGSKIKDAKFRDRFKNQNTDTTQWISVKKDGGAIDAITGATISSRAVCNAIQRGMNILNAHKTEIATPAAKQ